MGRTVERVKVKEWDPFVNHLDLVSYCRFWGDYDAGAYLLQEKPDSPPAIVFGWRLDGVHSYTPEGELNDFYDNFTQGLKDFPLSDSLMLRSRIRPDDTKRQRELERLIDSAPCDELKFFILSEKKRVGELGSQGLRCVKEDYLFVTYYSEAEKEATDWMEKALFWVQSQILSHFGANSYDQLEIERVFRSASSAQNLWHSYLTSKLGLKVYPLSAQQMYAYAWEIFNDKPVPNQFPQLLTYADGDLKLEQWSNTCPCSLLTAEYVPTADRAWVYNPASRSYCAVLTFLDKPYGWESVSDLFDYLYKLLDNHSLRDFEIVSQIWRGDSRLARVTMEKMIRQSVNRDDFARRRKNLDVGANLAL